MGVHNREVPKLVYRWVRKHVESLWIFLIYGNCGFWEFLKVKGCLLLSTLVAFFIVFPLLIVAIETRYYGKSGPKKTVSYYKVLNVEPMNTNSYPTEESSV